jgi:hypothetical protein
MKLVTTMAAQGDVLFRKVNNLPDGAKATKRSTSVTVAHSETGHDHVAVSVGDWLHWFAHPTDPLVSYLRVDTKADIVHKRDFDTHETFRLDAGIWEIRRQREWAPEGWRLVAD